MEKRKIQLALIYGLLFVAYNVIVFLVAKAFHTSFWVSYGFVVLSYVALVFGQFFVSNEKRANQVVGLPVGSLCWFYFVAELVMGTIFMFFNVSFVAVFLPQFVLFVLFALVFIPATLSPNNYKDQNTDKKE